MFGGVSIHVWGGWNPCWAGLEGHDACFAELGPLTAIQINNAGKQEKVG